MTDMTKRPNMLTPREFDVIVLSAEGKTAGEIATDLGISTHTARTHVKGALRALGARNKAHAVAMGHIDGWLS